MEERTLLTLVFSSLVILAETIAQKVFALFFLTLSSSLIWWSSGIAVASQVMQVTLLVTTTCGASSVLCCDFRALGLFMAFLVGCLDCCGLTVCNRRAFADVSDQVLPQRCKISNLRDQWVSLGHQMKFGSWHSAVTAGLNKDHCSARRFLTGI